MGGRKLKKRRKKAVKRHFFDDLCEGLMYALLHEMGRRGDMLGIDLKTDKVIVYQKPIQ